MIKQKLQNECCSKERGIALITALVVVLVVFMLIMSTMYVVTSSTTISGAGKRYATAAEAADGAVEVMKEAINLEIPGYDISGLPLTEDVPGDLITAIFNSGASNAKTVTLNLPGATFTTQYTARVTVERLYEKELPGGRPEFAKGGGGAGNTAVYFRISAVVEGPKNTRAETTALYRYTG